MVGELVITDGFNDSINEHDFELVYSEDGFRLIMYIYGDKDLDYQLKNKEELINSMEYHSNMMKYIDELSECEIKAIDYIENNFDNIMDSIELVQLNFEELDDKEFIINNPIIQSKKILLTQTLEIDEYEELLKLMDKYEDRLESTYVLLSGNSKEVSLLSAYKTMKVINDKASEIKKLGLSPMETIMYVYDQVRNRVYAYGNDDKDLSESRDLSRVLFGDKIVCVGYSNIFNAILNRLGINNYIAILDNVDENKPGHQRNVTYVRDEKYDIDGVYYFDPTWDSKRKEDNNSYLNRYTFFAKTKNMIEKGERLVNNEMPNFSLSMYDEVEEIIEDADYNKFVRYLKTINYMSKLVTGENLMDMMNFIFRLGFEHLDSGLFLEKFKEIFDKFDNEIPAETMLKVLNNVRKLEYYQDSSWYPYKVENLYNTMILSKWKFKDEHLNDYQRLLKLLFDQEDKLEVIDNFKNYALQNNLFKEVEQVKLTKVLQLIRDNKKSL